MACNPSRTIRTNGMRLPSRIAMNALASGLVSSQYLNPDEESSIILNLLYSCSKTAVNRQNNACYPG